MRRPPVAISTVSANSMMYITWASAIHCALSTTMVSTWHRLPWRISHVLRTSDDMGGTVPKRSANEAQNGPSVLWLRGATAHSRGIDVSPFEFL